MDGKMAAIGNGDSASGQMYPAAVSFFEQPLPLTEHNLKQLQPYIIQTMAPVTISSSHSPSSVDYHYATGYEASCRAVDDADNGDQKQATGGMESTTAAAAAEAVATTGNDEAEAKRQHVEHAKERAAREVTRLQFWVYSAMQTLLSLGPEGIAIVAADELYIAGPGDVRLKPRGPGGEATSGFVGVDKQEVLSGDTDTASNNNDIRNADAACPPKQEPLPNLTDPRYWRDKVRHFTQTCKPLAQARRQERRLAAKNAAANQSQQEELLEDALMEAWRIEQNRLLYKDKHSRMVKWVMDLEAQAPTRPPTPLYDDEADQALALYRKDETLGPERQNDEVADGPSGLCPAPPSSDSSIIEISPVQFAAATHDGNRQSNTPHDFTEPTTAKGTRASTAAPTTAPTTATNGNSEPQPEAKRRKSVRSSNQSTAAQMPRIAQTPPMSTSPELPDEATDVPQSTTAKHTSNNGAGVLGKRQRNAPVKESEGRATQLKGDV